MNSDRKGSEYHYLMRELRNDETRLVAYFRMKPVSFDALHEKFINSGCGFCHMHGLVAIGIHNLYFIFKITKI